MFDTIAGGYKIVLAFAVAYLIFSGWLNIVFWLASFSTYGILFVMWWIILSVLITGYIEQNF